MIDSASVFFQKQQINLLPPFTNMLKFSTFAYQRIILSTKFYIMKKIVLALTMIISMTALSNAQDYQKAIGIRGGYYNGITAKMFLGEKSAVEGILATRWSGFNVTALYEIYNDNAFDVDRLNWYYGVGGHIGFWNGAYTSWNDPSGSYIAIGVDGIIGIEYNFEEIPINISLDWKPGFNLIGTRNFLYDGGAASVRYYF